MTGAAPSPEPVAREASLSIRPTPAGMAVGAVALGSLPVGLVGLDFAFALGSLLLAVLVAAPLWARRAVRALEVEGVPPAMRPIAGRLAPLFLRLRARRPTWSTAVAVLDVRGTAREASGAARVAVPRMRAGEVVDAVLLARFPSRGRRVEIAIEIALAAPFALFDARRVLVAPCRVVVGPRPSAALAPALARWSRSRAAAAERMRPSRRGAHRDLPDGLRLARASTPARELAWAATIRTGRPIAYAREATPTPREIDVVLVLDARGRSRGADAAFEAAVRVTARTLHALRRSGAAPRLAFSREPARAAPTRHAAASAPVARDPRGWFEALADVAREAPGPEAPGPEAPGHEAPVHEPQRADAPGPRASSPGMRGTGADRTREPGRAIVIVAASPHEVRGARLSTPDGARERAGSDVALALVASDMECAVVEFTGAARRTRGRQGAAS